MTGIGWLDGTATVAFTAVAVLAVARLALGWRAVTDRADTAVHAVMAIGMASMALPGGGPLPHGAWVVVFAAVGVCTVAVCGRRAWDRTVGRPRVAPPSRAVPQLATAPTPSWPGLGRAAHHIVGCALMVVAFGAGHTHAHHGGHHVGAQPATRATAGPAATAPDATAAAEEAGPGIDPHAGHHMSPPEPTAPAQTAGAGATGVSARVDGTLRAAAGWPVWPAAAALFGAYAVMLATRRPDPGARCCAGTRPPEAGLAGADPTGASPTGIGPGLRQLALAPGPEQVCAVVMAVGMAAMAATL